jgi:hypothetical protein
LIATTGLIAGCNRGNASVDQAPHPAQDLAIYDLAAPDLATPGA